jgi:hypothetical protein
MKVGKALAAALSNSGTVVMPGAGYIVMVEHPMNCLPGQRILRAFSSADAQNATA